MSSVSSVSCCGTTPRRARICGPCGRRVHAQDLRACPAVSGETQPIIRIVDVLPAPFGPEEAERFAGGDVEVDGVDGGEVAEPLGQAAGMDERGRPGSRAWGRMVPADRCLTGRNVLHGGSRSCYAPWARGRPDRPAPGARSMATMPDARRQPARRGARRRADRRSTGRPAGHLSADPAVGRRARST